MAGIIPTIGRNSRVVLLWAGSIVPVNTITGFRANQEVKQQRSDPLNSTPVEFNTPSGWRGQFMVDRADPTVDNLFAVIEAGFWTSGIIGQGSIYQYITEVGGGTSTYEFVGVSLSLSDAGTYQQEQIVKQTISFFASQRNKL